MDGRDPVRLGTEPALAVADRHERDVAKLVEELRRAGLVEPPVERAHDRCRAMPREQEAHRLDMGMDDVVALVIGPGLGQADRHVRRDVAAVLSGPEAALDRGHERAAADLGIARRVERDFVATLDQHIAERGDHPFRARVCGRWNRQHRRRDQGNPKRTIRGVSFHPGYRTRAVHGAVHRQAPSSLRTARGSNRRPAPPGAVSARGSPIARARQRP